MIGGLPTKAQALSPNGELSTLWVEFLSDVYNFISGAQSSGPTSNRPTKNLYPGRFYFDTSLGANGKPIWLNKNGTGWVDASGASV